MLISNTCRALIKNKVGEWQHQEQKVNLDTQEDICMNCSKHFAENDFNNPVSFFRCGHIAHTHCMRTWIETKSPFLQCPECKVFYEHYPIEAMLYNPRKKMTAGSEWDAWYKFTEMHDDHVTFESDIQCADCKQTPFSHFKYVCDNLTLCEECNNARKKRKRDEPARGGSAAGKEVVALTHEHEVVDSTRKDKRPARGGSAAGKEVVDLT